MYQQMYHTCQKVCQSRTMNNDQQLLRINARCCTILNLSCSCKIELWKVLLVTAEQYQKEQDIVCPEHKVPHDFSNCPIFKDMALTFAEQFHSDNVAEHS